MHSQLHGLRVLLDSQQMTLVSGFCLVWLPNPRNDDGVDYLAKAWFPPWWQSSSQKRHECTINAMVIVPSALWKPHEKHEKGLHVQSHSKELDSSYFFSCLSFRGACSDCLFGHPFVQGRSMFDSRETRRTLFGWHYTNTCNL